MAKNKNLNFTFKEIDTAYKKLMQARSLSQKGNWQEAEKTYHELITEFPQYYAAHRELAKLDIEQGQFYSALQHLALALSGDQGDYFSLMNLEALTYELGMYTTAQDLSTLIEIICKKYGIEHQSDVHFFNKGKILFENRKYEEAITEFEKCIRENPGNEEATLRLIKCKVASGKHEEALKIAKKSIAQNSRKKYSYIYTLSDFPAALIKDDIKEYIPVLEKLDADKDESIVRDFSLANFYHMDGNYKKAWETITHANNDVKSGIKDKYLQDRRWEKDLLQWAEKTRFEIPEDDYKESQTLPLYILGPSRSGKSSLEKALDWLPGFMPGYENKLLSNATSSAFNAGDRLPATFLPFLPDPLLPAFVSRYRSLFRRKAQDASIFTTTTPGLITNVPAIIFALKRAKFIFLARDPDDTALRMYFTHYRNSNYHSYDIEWTLEYIRWYNDMVKIWEKRFPAAVMTVDYERLVARPVDTVKEILGFLQVKASVPPGLNVPDDRGFSRPYHQMYQQL